MTVTRRLLGAVAATRVVAGGRARARGAVVLAYHDLREDAREGPEYSVRPVTFRRHLLQARAAGVHFVDLHDLTARLLRDEPVDGLAAIVFDDALVGVHRHAAPTMDDLGVPATVFPVSQVLGAKPDWWPGSQRTLAPRELVELRGAGWTIGAHTRTHPSLPTLSAGPLRSELAGARADLEDLCGDRVDLVAYPYGHHDAAVRDAAREAGYTAGYTFVNGRVTHDLDRFRLPRLTMTEQHGRFRLAYHLARHAASWPEHQLEQITGEG
jgi:peptidoglycan/xylan/chitin deacetylase (PgdA/CDA1 family)